MVIEYDQYEVMAYHIRNNLQYYPKDRMGVSVCVKKRITYLWLRIKSEIDMVPCLDDNFK